MKQVAPHVYVEHGYHGVTVGCIVTPSGVVCIDSPTRPADAAAWRAEIARLTDQPVRFVVLTDAHPDRISGLHCLGGAVVAHEATWEKIKSYGDPPRPSAADSASGHADALQAHAVLPQITFTSRLVLYQGMTIVIQHVGGATPGSVWVHLPEQRVLFMGDLMACRTHPETSEGDMAAWLDLLAQVQNKSFPAQVIVPGRGGPCNKTALETMISYLQAMRTRVQSLVRSRKPRTDTALLVPEFLARYHVPGAEREAARQRIKAGLDHLYDTLKSKK